MEYRFALSRVHSTGPGLVRILNHETRLLYCTMLVGCILPLCETNVATITTAGNVDTRTFCRNMYCPRGRFIPSLLCVVPLSAWEVAGRYNGPEAVGNILKAVRS